MSSLFDISELAIMGLCEVIPSIPRVLKKNRTNCRRHRPSSAPTLSSPSTAGVSAAGTKKLRALKTGIPQIHYVAPQVWGLEKETRPYHVQIR